MVAVARKERPRAIAWFSAVVVFCHVSLRFMDSWSIGHTLRDRAGLIRKIEARPNEQGTRAIDVSSEGIVVHMIATQTIYGLVDSNREGGKKKSIAISSRLDHPLRCPVEYTSPALARKIVRELTKRSDIAVNCPYKVKG